jgi:excinuclease ABC subunit A
MQKPDVDHRRPVAGHLHRAEDDQPQPALHRRHGDRDLRLPAPAVRPRRHPYSPATGLPIESQTVTQMVDRVMELEEGTRLYLLAPIVRGRKGEYKQGVRRPDEAGLPAGQGRRRVYEIPTRRRSTRSTSTTSTWWWTASSCAMISDPAGRQFRDRAETADGLAIVEFADKPLADAAYLKGAEQVAEQRNPRADCFRKSSPAPFPASPSTRSSRGCFRSTTRLAPARPATALAPSWLRAELVVPDKTLSLRQGAIAPWAKTGATSPYYTQTLEALVPALWRSHDHAVGRAAREVRNARSCSARAGGDHLRLRRRAAQLQNRQTVRRRHRQHRAPLARNRFRVGARGAVAFQSDHPCQSCNGYRSSPGAGGQGRRPAHRRSREMSIREANDWFNALPDAPPSKSKSPRASSRKSASG